MLTSLHGYVFRIIFPGTDHGFPSQRANDRLMIHLLLALTSTWIASRVAGDLRRHDAHVTAMNDGDSVPWPINRWKRLVWALRIVDTDASVLKHQAIRIHSADYVFIVLDQCHTQIS